MTYTGDQKMGYALSGHQGQNSTRPCMYCLVLGPTIQGDDEGEMRTLGMNRKNYQDYLANGAKRKEASKYNNIADEPLFIGPDEKYILDCFPPPVLHLKLRSLNHICDHLTAETKQRFKDSDGKGIDLVLNFCKDNHIVKKSYFGGQYEGNMCNAILKKVDKLEDTLPDDLKKYTRCLANLNVVVQKACGMTVESGECPIKY